MARCKIILDELLTGNSCRLYSFTKEGKSQCEFDDFLDNTDVKANADDLDKILTVLTDLILEKNGALERYFRYEGTSSDRICALPTLDNTLRLYCIKISEQILIVGNGGKKSTRRYQDDVHLNSCVEVLQKVDQSLKRIESSGEVEYWGKTIMDYPLELTINL